MPSSVSPASTRRILLVKLSSLGDVVHALPLLESLRVGLGPDVFLGWAIRSKFAEILDGNPHLSQSYTLYKSGFGEIWTFSRQLQRVEFDTTLDAQGLLISGVVTWLSGAQRRIGLDANREGNALFLNEPVVPAKQRAHIVDKLMGFCDVLNIPRLPVRSQVYLAEGEREAALQMLTGSEGRPRIGCIIGASTAVKAYPVENWVRVVTELCACGLSPVLLGGPGERAAAEQIVQKAGSGVLCDLTGKTPLRLLSAVLAQCQVVIGGDSGPTHLAVAVGTPVVGLYGVTDPLRTGPQWGTARSITLDFAEQDAPPETRRPRHPTLSDAIARIPAPAVIQAVRTLMEE